MLACSIMLITLPPVFGSIQDVHVFICKLSSIVWFRYDSSTASSTPMSVDMIQRRSWGRIHTSFW